MDPNPIQLVIMNASSFVGRLSPGLFVRRRFGVINIVTVVAGCGAVLILSMIALQSVASVVVMGVLYGYCIGICAYSFIFPSALSFVKYF